MKISIDIELINITNFNSKSLIATILPNKKLLKFELLATNPERSPATPIDKDIIIDIDISPYLAIFFLMNSIDNADNMQNMIDATIGFILKTKPNVTPASEVCEIASPIIESLFNTTTTPMQGIITASIIPTRKALRIKSYSNISIGFSHIIAKKYIAHHLICFISLQISSASFFCKVGYIGNDMLFKYAFSVLG